MRRFLPYIAVVWGAAVIIRYVVKGPGGGAYGAGAVVAFLLAVALVIAGGRAILKPKRRYGSR